MHTIPKDLFVNVTKPAHFKVGVALYQLADSQGEVRTSTKDLAEFCNVSESTLTRAFRDLEAQGYLETQRSRKGFNRFSFNIYRLKLEVVESSAGPRVNGLWASSSIVHSKSVESNDALSLTVSSSEVKTEVLPSLKNEQSTADTVTNKSLVSLVSKKGIEILRISTPTGEPVEKPKSESEKKSKATTQKLSVDPRDFRTRGRRPVESWTTWDIAAEFADELQKKFPSKPLLINKKQLAAALLPMRSRYGSTAEAEMWLMKIYFMDKAKLRLAVTAPSKVIGAYLNLFKTHLDKAIYAVSQPIHEEFVYADDGREFDNSIPGRLQRDRYNEKLKIRSEISS